MLCLKLPFCGTSCGCPPDAAFLRSSICPLRDCVEVARGGGIVIVRDSKHPDGTRLRVLRITWEDFIDLVKSGRFELDAIGTPVVQDCSIYAFGVHRTAPDEVRLYRDDEREIMLIFSDAEWTAFLAGVKAGEFSYGSLPEMPFMSV